MANQPPRRIYVATCKNQPTSSHIIQPTALRAALTSSSAPEGNRGTQATSDSLKWTLEYRRGLIQLCISMNVKRLAFNKKWHTIATELGEKFPSQFSGIQCKNQWAKEMQKYRECVDPPTGASRPKPYEFFDELHNYIGDDPSIKPLYLVSTMVSNKVEDTLVDDSQVPASTIDMDAPSPKRPRITATNRRVSRKDDIFNMLNDFRKESQQFKREVWEEYEKVNEKVTLTLEKVVRCEEQRMKNETRLLEIEEARLKNENKRLENESRIIALEEKRLQSEQKMLDVLSRLPEELTNS